MSNGDLEALWSAAIADAQLDPAAVRLYGFTGEVPPTVNQTASWHSPGESHYLARSNDEPLSDSQLADANSNQNRTRHRITMWIELPPQILASKLRHELEHARQWDVAGESVDEISRMVRSVGSRLFSRYGRGTGILYNLVPSERDANAAGARFARARFGEPPDDLVQGESGVLFRFPEGPEPADELGRRLIAYVAVFGDEFERLLQENNRDLAQVLNGVAPNIAGSWELLRDDERLAELRRAISDAVPAEPQIDAPDADRERVWREVGVRVEAAYGRARELLEI
jgi:hypothetical protein